MRGDLDSVGRRTQKPAQHSAEQRCVNPSCRRGHLIPTPVEIHLESERDRRWATQYTGRQMLQSCDTRFARCVLGINLCRVAPSSTRSLLVYLHRVACFRREFRTFFSFFYSLAIEGAQPLERRRSRSFGLTRCKTDVTQSSVSPNSSAISVTDRSSRHRLVAMR